MPPLNSPVAALALAGAIPLGEQEANTPIFAWRSYSAESAGSQLKLSGRTCTTFSCRDRSGCL